MKLGLGTVQFGLEYGISNRNGQTPEGEAAGIIDAAMERGIRVIDTAAQYGRSEEVLGMVLPRRHEFDIVTKTVRIDTGRIMLADADRMEAGFRASLERLGCEAVYGLLVHNADDLLAKGGNIIMERLHTLKRRGLVQKIGVSVYGASQIDSVLELFDIDLVQVPVNVLDQRLISNGSLGALKRRGIEVHARSAFLQGLLLMPPHDMPSYFAPIRQHLIAYREYVAELGVTPLQAALGFLEARDDIDVIVCGVNSRTQLLELCDGVRPFPVNDLSLFAIEDDAMLNPTRWRIS